jgi:hypothetical protein
MVPLARSRLVTLFALGSLASAACGTGATTHAAAQSTGPAGKDPTGVARFLPLVDGDQLAYDTVDEETGKTGMFVTTIHRTGAMRVDLRTGGASKSLEIAADGIVRSSDGSYLLKAPIAVGARWPGEGGGTVRVTAVDKTVQIPAGLYVGCVETTEDKAGEPRRRTTTVYCPDVGIAVLEVEAWGGVEHALERATVRSFGPPVNLGGKSE